MSCWPWKPFHGMADLQGSPPGSPPDDGLSAESSARPSWANDDGWLFHQCQPELRLLGQFQLFNPSSLAQKLGNSLRQDCTAPASLVFHAYSKWGLDLAD